MHKQPAIMGRLFAILFNILLFEAFFAVFMEQVFTPKVIRSADGIAVFFDRVSRFLLLALVALLPFVFIPGLVGPFKTFFALLVVLVAVVMSSFGILRKGMLPRSVPVVLLAWMGVVIAALISALLSVDVVFSLRGDAIETYTVTFLVLLGLVMTLMLSLEKDKKTATWIVLVPIVSASILALHQVARFLFTGKLLDFGVLVTPSDTLIGGFNDLGIFLTASVLIMMLAVIQLALSRSSLLVVLGLVILHLFLLMVINIEYIWVTLGLTSLLFLMYLLTKDRLAAAVASTKVSLLSVIIMSLICIVSVVFFIGGSSLGAKVSQTVGVNYIEVRPSVTATLNITRQTLADNAFTGIGPNRFSDAWLLYKDQSINPTAYWNTSFASGSSYVLTWFATTGIFGIVTWVVFFVLFVYRGVKTLFITENRDPLWFFVGTVSFVIATFLWGTLWLLVAGPVIVLLAALMTGVYLAADKALHSQSGEIVPIQFTSSRASFILIAIIMMVVVMTVATSYAVTRQFIGLVTYVNTVREVATNAATPVNQVNDDITRAYAYYKSDIFLRGIIQYQVAQINTLLSVTDPDADQRQKFSDAIEAIIRAAGTMVELRPYRAQNWSILGDVYVFFSQLNIDQANTRAIEAYTRAQALDPQNPYYALQIGLVNIRSNDVSGGRTKIAEALRLKPNYVEALSVLAQLDIEAGNLDEAIANTEALSVFEPNNPARFYQLGILYGAADRRESALDAFTRAIALNPQFANARYLRALHIYATGKIEEAITELETIKTLDQNNAVIDEIIVQMQAGTLTPNFRLTTTSVNEPTSVSVQDAVVTASEAPNSDLVSSVNTPARTENSTVAPLNEIEVVTEPEPVFDERIATTTTQ